MIDRLVVATKNPHKRHEMVSVLGDVLPGVQIVDGPDWEDVDETGDTLEENALLKARAVAAATGLPALADDTGLEVDALGGAPGVRSARFAGETASFAENRARLLARLAGEADRSARFRTVVALALPDGGEAVAVGILEGRITQAERGSGGFGYDALFEVGATTLAEMTDEEKNRVSHRARALRALARILDEAGGTNASGIDGLPGGIGFEDNENGG